MKLFQYKNWAIGAAAALLGLGAVSCEDQPDKFELTGGNPTVKYVRVPDPEKADSLLTSAYMENLICLVGDNLTSIKEMYFNDQKAILNTSYITDHTILVNIPKEIPQKVTDKIYMVTAGGDTCTYDFRVLVPQPSVRSMSCEYAKPGMKAALIGDYFIDDPNSPLTITFPGNVDVTEILSVAKNRVEFIVPEGATPGYINCTSLYGTGRSAFQYMDARAVMFDWDGSHDGQKIAHGWRDGSKVFKNPGDNDFEAIDGPYVCFAGDLQGGIGADFAEDGFSFNYWPDPSAGYPAISSMPNIAAMLDQYELSDLQIKFELLVPSSNPWQSCAMQLIFTGDEDVTYANATNSYITSNTLPRALWNPWLATGSYDTAGEWTTIAVPMSSFTSTHEGAGSGGAFNKDRMTGFTMFVYHGGVEGTDCSPMIAVDNIRISPIE